MDKKDKVITYIPIIGAIFILSLMCDLDFNSKNYPTYKKYKVQVIIQILSFLSLAGLPYII